MSIIIKEAWMMNIGLETEKIEFKKDYDSWVNRLHEDELNIQNRI